MVFPGLAYPSARETELARFNQASWRKCKRSHTPSKLDQTDPNLNTSTAATRYNSHDAGMHAFPPNHWKLKNTRVLTKHRAKSLSAPSRSLRKRRSRIARFLSGSASEQATPSGTITTTLSPRLHWIPDVKDMCGS